MRKRTIRTMLKYSYPLNVVLLAFVVLDYLFWDSAGTVVLLSLLALLLIAVVVLVSLDEKPRFLRIEGGAEPEPPMTIIYGADHGRP